jgi:hypothetical protein
MKHSQCIILFFMAGILIGSSTYADNVDVYPISLTPRLYLEGKIGDYTIEMNLFLRSNTINGFYKYANKNSPLQLLGELNSDRILLYEYAQHENTGISCFQWFPGQI